MTAEQVLNMFQRWKSTLNARLTPEQQATFWRRYEAIFTPLSPSDLVDEATIKKIEELMGKQETTEEIWALEYRATAIRRAPSPGEAVSADTPCGVTVQEFRDVSGLPKTKPLTEGEPPNPASHDHASS